MSPVKNPAIPPGSTVLVTGANGYIASHVCDEIVRTGCKVRGTVRDVTKHAWMPKFFEEHYGPGKFELVEVKDFQDAEVVKNAIKDVHGIVHAATDTSFSPDPNEVVTPTVNGTLTIAKAAAAEQSVKRLVYTSSQIAAFFPVMDKIFTVTQESWFNEAVELAWAPPPYAPQRALYAYAASKVQAEKGLLEFVRSERPGFVLNTVLPNFTMGLPLSVEDTGYVSSMSTLPPIFLGDDKAFKTISSIFPPEHFVAVDDIARLHVIALLQSDVQNERLFGFAEPMGWNDVLAIFRRNIPDREFLPDIPGEGKVKYIVEPRERADRLLKEYKGSERGFRSVEDAIMESVQKFVEDPKAELKGRLWS